MCGHAEVSVGVPLFLGIRILGFALCGFSNCGSYHDRPFVGFSFSLTSPHEVPSKDVPVWS